MIKPDPDLARRTLLAYHDVVSDLRQLVHLESMFDMDCESKAQKLERTLSRLKRNRHSISSLSYLSKGYEFDFKTAGYILEAIKKDKPYSTSALQELSRSIPTIKEFVVSASIAFA